MKIRLTIMTALALLLVAPLAMAGTIELPKDLQELLPAEPGALICIQSIEELDAQMADLEKALAEEGEEEEIDITAMLTEQLPRFEEMIDTGKPMAIAVDFSPIIMGQEPYLTLVVPLKDSFTERDSVGFELPPSSYALQGDYAALNTGGYLEAAGVSPAIAQDLAPGVIAANLDFEALLTTYGSFIDMGLAAIPVGVGEADTLEDGTVVTSSGMTQEEVDALTEMVRALTTSLKRMDMGFGVEDGRMALDTRMDVIPGSPLAPGPQPDFDEALAATGLLPDGGDFIMALAMDMAPQFAIFEDFYIQNMRRETEKLGEEIGAKYSAWFEEYLGAKDLWALPMAASYRFGDGGMIGHMALKSPNAKEDMDRLVSLFEGLSDVGMGLTLVPVDMPAVDGVAIRHWTLEFAPDGMMGFTGTPANPELGGMGRMQAEQMTAVMQKIVPGLSVCAQGDYVLVAADEDPTRLTDMIKAAGKGNPKPHHEAKRVAKAAGKGVAEVVTGDMMAILTWVTAFMAEVDDEEWDVIEGNPIPFDGAYTLGEDRYGFAMNIKAEAVRDLILALDALDFDDDSSEYMDEVEAEREYYEEEEMIADEEEIEEEEY